ncbi:MAG: hypothetical protein QMC78_05730 [Methanocellales archaeon]|nr:hypothetical protein [Methanocellales archaeon]
MNAKRMVWMAQISRIVAWQRTLQPPTTLGKARMALRKRGLLVAFRTTRISTDTGALWIRYPNHSTGTHRISLGPGNSSDIKGARTCLAGGDVKGLRARARAD